MRCRGHPRVNVSQQVRRLMRQRGPGGELQLSDSRGRTYVVTFLTGETNDRQEDLRGEYTFVIRLIHTIRIISILGVPVAT